MAEEPRARLVFGEDRICPRCGGRGAVEVRYRSPGMKEPSTTTTPCARCNGTGKIQ